MPSQQNRCPAGPWWLLLALTSLLTGCLNWPQQHTPLQVPSPWLPEAPRVLVLEHAGRYLGLFGNLLAAADLRSKSERLALAMQQRGGFGLRLHAQQQLHEKLLGAGFAPTYSTVVRGAEPLRVLPTGDGPVLDLQLRFAGYAAEHVGKPYVPVVQLVWRLLDAQSGVPLDSGIVLYGTGQQQPGMRSLSADPAWVFADFAALLREPEHAATGLRVALDASFLALGGELRRAAER